MLCCNSGVQSPCLCSLVLALSSHWGRRAARHVGEHVRFIPVSDMVGAVSGFRASARQGSLHRCHQQLGTASFAESLGRSRVTQWTFPLLLMPTMLDRLGASVPKSFQSGRACAGFSCGCARRWVRAFHTRFKQCWLRFRPC